MVNSEPIEVEEVESGNIVPNEGLIENTIVLEERKENTNLIEDSFNDKHDYFEETRIERERMYSEMLETYEKLMKNVDIPNDQKAIAVQEISNITNIKNGIMISENLIKNKGFEDAIILVNNNTASVVVKSYTLSQEQISKIQNIIQRELQIEAKNINISNKF